MPIPHARRMNLIALALLVTALIAFVSFHFLVIEYDDSSPDMGWEIWPTFFDTLKNLDITDMEDMLATSAFFTYCLLVIASPFSMVLLRNSRPLWWISTITSGGAFCTISGMICLAELIGTSSTPGPGLYCLLASLALNFLGLLFIRREVPATPEVDPA